MVAGVYPSVVPTWHRKRARSVIVKSDRLFGA
jgi:hypothetical protein